jgi:glycosyltransferase involved in cell wall biosynthesis
MGMGSRANANEMLTRATELGVGDRVILLDPVPPDLVVATIRDATLGMLPLRRNEQHEVAMPNKLFQYVRARLPIVTSDCRQSAAFVRRFDIGEVFAAEDSAALARAVGRALGRIGELRSHLADSELQARASWEYQEPALISVYSDLGVLP